ncbi:myotubularin-related protein 9-like [Oscarella lobularis]|uniref:myotubularin-related protein 9-like n=1 Tax=Oscarella lobularis TaxID=121494 RepID=UPI00331319AA
MDLVEFVKISRIGGVKLKKAGEKDRIGALCLTSHQMIFSCESDDPAETYYKEILHTKVASVQRTSPTSLRLRLRDFDTIRFGGMTETDAQKCAETIESLSQISDAELRYPFYYCPRFTSAVRNGWTMFEIEAEFDRMGCPPNKWRVTKANANYALCETYPKSVIIPKGIEDEGLAKVARFRRDGRFPVLSYYHRSRETAILRSSEPLSDHRSREDENHLKAALMPGKRGFIIDTRSHAVAGQRRKSLGGGGVEIEAHYPHWRRVHCAVAEPSRLASAIEKFVDACLDQTSGMTSWLSRAESSNWLSYVCDLLTAACSVAQCVDRDACTVLIHGSHGVDTTLQVCALAQVLLDAHARTARGFQALVDREWIRAGHPFADRTAAAAGDPVFLLFLDGVYQVMRQFPLSFEFNDRLLVFLFDHAHASPFGTFLGNCERSRAQLDVEKRCASLWSYLDQESVSSELRNPLYRPHSGALWPSVAAQSFHFWQRLYLKADVGPRPRTRMDEVIQDAVKERRELDEKLGVLKDELRQLRESVNKT